MRLALLALSAAAIAAGTFAITGCIGARPANPAATQPVTEIDPATTQPSFWYAKPAISEVDTGNFDAAIEACKVVARSYLFEIDRVDYRGGLVTTLPLVSKQWFEPWRPDTGTMGMVLDNSIATIRRTLVFQIVRNADNSFTISPKVLVERESLLERRITDVTQYRQVFSGPAGSHASADRAQISMNEDAENPLQDLPPKYWFPIARDTKMELGVGARLRGKLPLSAAVAARPVPAVLQPAAAVSLKADGAIIALGPDQTVYIDLGAADKVVPGMTFEVYEARAALPAVGQYAKNNPGAKGWIEVIAVGSASATCRTLSMVGSARPVQGDQVFNFIYERGRQNRFTVAGDFATAAHDTLTGLIWRWNGIVDDRPTDKTQYVVLGAPPKDPAAAQAYAAIKAQAEQLKIPTLNEDQFNLLIRYYDPSKR